MFVVLLVSVCWCASALGASAPYYKLEDAASYFEDFITKYDKQYAHEKEREARFYIFVENLKDVNQKNNASKYTTYGITKFMDLTLEEFKTKYIGHKAPKVSSDGLCQMLGDNDVNDDAPDSFDWREHQAVGPVKSQEICRSSYAFSSTGHIEGQYAIKYGNLISLSEQQILDCDHESYGCTIGMMTAVYSSIILMGGIEEENTYPYQAAKGDCNFNKTQVAVVLKKCYQYQLSNQEKIKQLLHKVGPISIYIDGTPLKSYTGGIIKDRDCASYINQAVLLVGYGTSKDGQPYWIAKNSFSEDWGEQGYFKMERTDDGDSCGMMNEFMTSVEIQ